MGNNRSIIDENTMVGSYRVSEVQIFNGANYPGGKYVIMGSNMNYYDANYNVCCAHEIMNRKRMDCMIKFKQAVIDGRIDIMDDIYSKRNLIGYMELNIPFLPLDFRNVPLMYEAASRNNIEVVRWLLDKGVPDHSTFFLWGGFKTASDVTTSQEIKNLINDKASMNMQAYNEAKKFCRSSIAELYNIWLMFLT